MSARFELAQLPAPPAGKQGWPWQVTPAATAANITGWPKISVVTPSFNQGQFIEQTIRSVLLQNYPNLEYLVIDGGSSDASVDVIRKYAPWLSYWVSEPDRGQSHAINKGFARATGDILCWLNSDDYFAPDTLQTAARVLSQPGNQALVGHTAAVYQDGRPPLIGLGRYENRMRVLKFWKGYQMHQPSIFWRRAVFEKVGLLREDLHQIMDFDYWLRMAEHVSFVNVDQVLSYCNQHPAAKTSDNCLQARRDMWTHRYDYWGSPWSRAYWELQASAFKYRVIRPVMKRLKLVDRPSKIGTTNIGTEVF